MQAQQDHYPIFEANQVLSNRHLNDVVNYLDEQTRLTRANLIGIGIVCGLEIEFRSNPSAAIRLSKGLGVSSAGYLLIEPDDVELVAYRTYALPDDLAYPPLADFPLWELFPDGEPNTTPLTQPAGFLDDKAVLLFLELKKAGLRNCSPNNCDDKGSAVTVTLRRLLIGRNDLEQLIADANGLGNDLSAAELAQLLADRLNLPDLRLMNYDVPNSQPVTTEAVWAAFQAIFKNAQVVSRTAQALSSAYQAFKPLVEQDYGVDPFSGFEARFGFLDSLPTAPGQVRFLQYYYDLFDDLLAAYNEFRWQGLELFCLCCPDEDLFPRHLMLGLVFPESVGEPDLYRQRFLPSPAVSACTDRVRAVLSLFKRLVGMIASFTENPPLPDVQNTAIDGQIRITPSLQGTAPLSVKAIPYYFLENGQPPLYRVWNPQLNRRGRAMQNLSYRADEYASDDFVLAPLRYDTEPYDFLRIEGHLGKPYQQVLKTLLTLKTDYRLPIEIVALRTGVFDETIDVDIGQEACYFDDLNTLYRAYKREIDCAAKKVKKTLFDKKIAVTAKAAGKGVISAGTLGELYAEKYQDRDICNLIDITEPQLINAAIGTLGYLDHLMLQLTDDVSTLEWQALNNHIANMKQWMIDVDSQKDSSDTSGEIDWAVINEVWLTLIDLCKLEALKLIEAELKRRIREVQKLKFLSFFQQNHPGLRHKAGVPMGGTFVIVYHEKPKTKAAQSDIVTRRTGGQTVARNALAAMNTSRRNDFARALEKVKADVRLMANPELRAVIEGITQAQAGSDVSVSAAVGAGGSIFEKTAAQLADGSVIADFYLPYLCCSNCAPVQFVLPRIPPTFTVAVSCTDANNEAEVTVAPEGGVPPYRVQLDSDPYTELSATPLIASAGSHTVRIKDAEGTESEPQSLVIVEPLGFGEPSFVCDENNAYTATIPITGGTPPYTVNGAELAGSQFVSDPVASGATLTVTVTDSRQCSASTEVVHQCEPPCDLPCGGQSRRCAYRLWLQPPRPGTPYEIFNVFESAIRFRFNGKDFEIPSDKVFGGMTASDLNQDFDNAIGGAVKILNELINELLIENFGSESNRRLILSYRVSDIYPFRVLQIEHFVCDSFNLEFDFEYARPSPIFAVTVLYTHNMIEGVLEFNGMILTDHTQDNRQTRVPAFNCSERNRCSETDFVAVCKGADLKPTFTAEQSSRNSRVFSAQAEGADASDIVAWLWDFPDATPNSALSSGQKTEVSFISMPSFAVLTVISRDGCFETFKLFFVE
ncbi:MAG: hypothetical protein ACU83N_07800 [Gammaproteobacteria bacterium]